MTASADFLQGTKKQVAEIKFLIHDLRVERFINNMIHFHTTLDTDLEIFEAAQAHAMHADDLVALRQNAAHMRKAFAAYSNAVKNFLPDEVILKTGRDYIDTIQQICELVLNPLWGRFDRVITFLPDEARSVRSRNHYRNTIRWICGVYYRIQYFLQELDNHDVTEEFDIGDDIIDYTNNVILGYIVEKGRNKVEIQIDRESQAVVRGNLPRFRRMFFNLVMNAVDALRERSVGMINVRIWTHDEDKVSIAVRDNGVGMYPEKIAHLMRDIDTLDGELHSLGFVFVRQTAASFGGELNIESTPGAGTTMTITIPYLAGHAPVARRPSKCSQYGVMPFQQGEDAPPAASSGVAVRDSSDGPPPEPDPDNWDPADKERNLGRIIRKDYDESNAHSPGCIFFVGVRYDNTVDVFAHQAYEESWDIGHEDLNPMLYDSVIRGRYEQDAARKPQIILKEPHSAAAYFEVKEIEGSQSPDRYVQLIGDEYILIARKLLATGLAPDEPVHVTNAAKYLPGFEKILGPEPFALEALATMKLSTEE